jgi:predicted RNase H-like HicB family nuclease
MVLRFYPAQITQDEDSAGGYGVVFADFPGCTSFGETVQAAADAATEALALHVEGMAEERLPFPQPSGPLDVPEWLAEAPGRVVTTVMVPVEVPGRSVRANVTLDEGLLSRLDSAAAAAGTSRSGFIAEAVRERLRR